MDTAIAVAGKRQKLYTDANVPEIIEILHPPFTARDGTRFPATPIKVISTYKKKVSPTVELTAENLTFFSVAAHHCNFVCPPATAGNDDDKDDFDYQIDEPNVHWTKRGNNQWRLAVSVRQSNGKWTTQYKSVPLLDEAREHNDEIIRRQAKELQMWYDKHHNPQSTAESSVSRGPADKRPKLESEAPVQ